jgi:hypothetical protein
MVHRAEQFIPGAIGLRLLVKDQIQTEGDSSAGIILHDGARIALGPNSTVSVDDFVFDRDAGKFSLLLRFLRGIIAYTSGKIEQFSPQSVRVETPSGVIGLRGTTFAVSIPESAAKP